MNVVFVTEHGLLMFLGFFFAYLCVLFVFAIVDNKVLLKKLSLR